jgi:hypothetical protein
MLWSFYPQGGGELPVPLDGRLATPYSCSERGIEDEKSRPYR